MIKSLFIVNGSNDVLYEKHYERTGDKTLLVPFYDQRPRPPPDPQSPHTNTPRSPR